MKYNELIRKFKYIKKNPNKVLTNQYLSSEGYYVQYSIERECFEYQNGFYLGDSSIEVIMFFRKRSEWFPKAKWVIKDK